MTIHIRFAPEILRRLGEELNPSIDQGILELVKNAYDANARKCIVRLTNVERPGGRVRITDNGDGMTRSDIVDGWLVLGRSRKDAATTTRTGRVPAGNKGLGRLAALRMGSSTSLLSRPRGSDREYRVKLDWSRFDKAQTVEEVAIAIASAKRTVNRTGTQIDLENLRRAILRSDMKRLARSLVLLADPFEDDPEAFTIELRAPEFEEYEAQVKKRYFEEAEYHLVATLGADGLATAEVRDYRGKTLYRGAHDDIASKERKRAPYRCPPAVFDLWAFLLNADAFRLRPVTLGEVRQWLDNFGGVHLYANGLRVAPYGNAGVDWLDMNLRRVRSPEERPGTNTSIGRIRVDDRGGELVQKTDRSGFLEDEAFQELRSFARDALDWMARRRLRTAEQRRNRDRSRAQSEADASREAVTQELATLPAARRKKAEAAFRRYDRARERQTDLLRREVQLYRTLSTAGITAATFAHETRGNPIKVLAPAVDALERRGKREFGSTRFTEVAGKQLASIKRAVEAVSVLASATLRLLDHEKRRTGVVSLHPVIAGVIDTFEPFLEGRDVKTITEFDVGEPYLSGTEAAVESIVTNLVNNSLTAFEGSDASERVVVIRTTIVDDEVMRLSVLDNGPGIEGISVSDVWLPGESTRPNGTGLGLTIVRDAAADLGGTVEAIAHGEFGGAEFHVDLPVLGA